MLSNGKIGDDNLQIAESGNGIPDIIDEARYEVDFWLRLRDGNGGYSAGVNNPNKEHTTMYQAAAKPYMAWASAANAAMLADAFRIAGKTDLMNQYKDAAIEAWKIANEQDLDLAFGIGNGAARGRDLKMLAAAFLYNVTGDRMYEDAMAKESVATSPTAAIDNKDKSCQFWGTAAYLMCAKYQLATDPPPGTVGQHEGRHHQRSHAEERQQLRQVALAPQQRHALWLVPDHASRTGHVHRSRGRHGPGRQRQAAPRDDPRKRLRPGQKSP